MKQLKTEKRNNGWLYLLISFGISLIAAFLYWVVLSPSFATNDDTAMASISYGYSGEYETNLVFIHPFVGYALRFMLRRYPAVPWYSVFQFFLLFVSLCGTVFVFLKRGGIKKAAIPVAVFFAYFAYSFFCRIQFTQTAGIACIAGFLLLFFFLESGGSWFTAFAGIVLIFVGSLYRFAVFEMLLIPFFGVGLKLLVESISKREWKRLVLIISLVLCTFALCFSSYVFHARLNNSTEEWREFTEYNKLRSQLLDYGFPSYEENEAVYQQLNISKEDLNMFCCWNFADPEVFNISSMRVLVNAKEARAVSLGEFVMKVGKGWVKYSFFPAIAICLAFALSTEKAQKRALWLVFYELLALAGVIIYLYCEGRYLMERVDITLALGICMILLCYCWQGGGEFSKRCSCLIAVVLVLTTLNSGIKTYAKNRSDNTSDNVILQEIEVIDEFLSKDMDHLYLMQVSALPGTNNVFRICGEGSRSNRYVLGGWTTDAPFMNCVLEHYGIDNPYRDCVNNPTVYFLAKGESGISQSLSYIQRHYFDDAEAKCVEEIDGGYKVFRVVSSESAN